MIKVRKLEEENMTILDLAKKIKSIFHTRYRIQGANLYLKDKVNKDLLYNYLDSIFRSFGARDTKMKTSSNGRISIYPIPFLGIVVYLDGNL